MKKGLLCPNCGKFETWEEIKEKNSWLESFREYNAYGARKDGNVEGVVVIYDSEHVETEHKCGFETNHRAEDFEVAVHPDGTVEFLGGYWQDVVYCFLGRCRVLLLEDVSKEERVIFELYVLSKDEEIPKDVTALLKRAVSLEIPNLKPSEINLPYVPVQVDWKGRVFVSK